MFTTFDLRGTITLDAAMRHLLALPPFLICKSKTYLSPSLCPRASLCAVVLQAFWHAHNIYRGMEVQPTKQGQEEGSVSSVIVVIRANAGKLIVVPTSQLLQINEEKANICANSVLRQILASIPFHFQRVILAAKMLGLLRTRQSGKSCSSCL